MRTRTEKFPSSYLCFPSISTQTTAEHPPDRSLKYDDCSEKCVDRFGNHGTISLSIQKDTVKIIFQAFYRRIWKMSAGVRDGRFEFTNSSVRPYRIKKKNSKTSVCIRSKTNWCRYFVTCPTRGSEIRSPAGNKRDPAGSKWFFTI